MQGVRRLVGRPSPRLTILYYHAITERDAPAFARQVAALRRIAASFVRPDHDGPLPDGRDAVALTFDDAFVSVYDNALSVLEGTATPATVYVPTGVAGRAPGWEMESDEDRAEEVASLDRVRATDGRFAYGSHTVSHPFLTKLDDARLTEELVGSRAALEATLGRKIDTIALPYGDHDDRVVAACADAGYRHVFSILPERIDTTRQKMLRGRTKVSPVDGEIELLLKASGAYAWQPLASRLKHALRFGHD